MQSSYSAKELLDEDSSDSNNGVNAARPTPASNFLSFNHICVLGNFKAQSIVQVSKLVCGYDS